jgi:hypothetical protein
MQLALDLSPPESKHYRSWSERLRYVARYSQPEEIHILLEKAHSIGVRSVMAVLDPRIETALREFQSWRPDMDVWAVVPNMNAFIRDLTDRGMVGAAFSRFRRLRPTAMIATGMNALRDLGPLARADFSAGALWLAQMELAATQGLRVRRVFLHPQLTEIALAGRVKPLFVEFARRARASGFEPGLVTHNPTVAARVIGEDLDVFAAIVAPCNPKGYKMVPNVAAGAGLFRSDPARYWGSEVTGNGHMSPGQGLTLIRTLGLTGAVLDLPSLDLLFRDHLSHFAEE